MDYKGFFEELWAAYCDMSLDMESAETIREIGMKHGLIVEEEYKVDVHGERIGSEWGLEEGDPVYYYHRPKATQPNEQTTEMKEK